MDNLIIMNKVIAIGVWIIFGGFVLIIRSARKNEFQAVFAGVKKMTSAATGMFIFFTLLNFVLAEPNGTMIKQVSTPWIFVSLELLGYAMIFYGFTLIMQVAWSFQNPIPDGPKFNLFKYLQKKMYLGTTLIAFGSTLIFLNPLALVMSVALIPFVLYRIKTEDRANANI